MPQSGKSSKFKFRILIFNAESQRFFYIVLDMRVYREQPCCLQRTQRPVHSSAHSAKCQGISPCSLAIYVFIYSFSLCASAFRNKELAKVESFILYPLSFII